MRDALAGFNGAAPGGARKRGLTTPMRNAICRLQRGRARGGAETGSCSVQGTKSSPRFNGAAPGGARKQVEVAGAASRQNLLQRGRARGGAETGSSVT